MILEYQVVSTKSIQTSNSTQIRWILILYFILCMLVSVYMYVCMCICTYLYLCVRTINKKGEANDFEKGRGRRKWSNYNLKKLKKQMTESLDYFYFLYAILSVFAFPLLKQNFSSVWPWKCCEPPNYSSFSLFKVFSFINSATILAN